MSRGLGRVQRRILEVLAEDCGAGVFAPAALNLEVLCQRVYGVEEEVSSSDSRHAAVARAVRGLERQGLVAVIRAMKGGHPARLVMPSVSSILAADGTLRMASFGDGYLVETDSDLLLPRLPNCSVGMAYLDPPYNLQLHPRRSRRVSPGRYRRGQVAEWDEFASSQAYDEALRPILTHLLRVLKPDGSLWLSGSYHGIHRVATQLQDLGAWFFAEIALWRPDAPPPFPHMKRPQMIETLLWVTKGREGLKLVQRRYDHELMVSFAREDFGRRQPLSIWKIPVCRSPERLREPDGAAVHPTQKPIELLKRMIRLSTTPGELVLDPMAGTGTTGAAARELGRSFLLIERERAYVAAATERLASQPSDAAGRPGE